MALDAAAYAYTASDGTENVGLRELRSLDIVPRSLGVLVRGSVLCRFIEKDSRVLVTNSKALWP